MAQIAYTENKPSCKLCRFPAFGAFVATFEDKEGFKTEDFVFLCAECGFTRAWISYTTKRLKGLRLEVIFKFPAERNPQAVKPPVPEAIDFVASEYNATFLIEGDHYTGPLDPCSGHVKTFASEWAALERARQVGQALAKGMKKSNHWAVQTGITRVGKEG